MCGRERKGRKEKWEIEEEGVGSMSKEVVSFSRVLWKVKVYKERAERAGHLPAPQGWLSPSAPERKPSVARTAPKEGRLWARGQRGLLLSFPAPSTSHVKTILEIL